MYRAEVLADSLSPENVRLTTFLVRFPRFILAEVNTHRVLSRNFESSRAVPVARRIADVRADPFVPLVFGRNQRGMQATQSLDADEAIRARSAWLEAARSACDHAETLAALGVHKQLANRVMEPYSYVSGIITATEWSNFFALRCHPDAQPEFRHLAELMRTAMGLSEPARTTEHLPWIRDEDRDHPERFWISAGRCARVSYNTHEGVCDPAADADLARKLVASGHMSPLEHPAAYYPYPPDDTGNLRGWVQFRKTIHDEHDFGAIQRRTGGAK